MHAYVISTLATRLQHRRKMETQPEKAFCVLEFHSTKSAITVQREFRRKFEKDPPTANSIRKWHQKFVVTGCICKGKSSGRPSMSAQIDRVRQTCRCRPRKSTRRASRELNAPQPTPWKILLSRPAEGGPLPGLFLAEPMVWLYPFKGSPLDAKNLMPL
jgi:hypothetical protein